MGILRFMLLLLNISVYKIAAQPDCAYVLGLLNDEEDADRFFQVLRDFESEGDLCKINGTNYKIGPYQISKEYYDVAVAFNETLRQGQFNPEYIRVFYVCHRSVGYVLIHLHDGSYQPKCLFLHRFL